MAAMRNLFLFIYFSITIAVTYEPLKLGVGKLVEIDYNHTSIEFV
jgi:hypothetical protein